MLVAMHHQPPQERVLPDQRQGGLRVRRSPSRCCRSPSARSAPGEWSLDQAIFDPDSFLFEPKKALIVTAIVGIGGTAAFLGGVLASAEEGPGRGLGRRSPGEPHMGRVALDQVSKRFDDVVAVDDLTLDVADEEFLVLLGPSGCGKSTALRMIAGLEDPTSGTITIGDRVVNDVEAKDRDIAMVFQSYALYPHMTVRQEHRVPAAVAQGAGGGARHVGAGSGREPRPRRVARPQARAALGRSTPAGRARARDRAPARRCSSWTSRCRTSTPSCACRRAPSSSSCSAGSRPPSSTSPTTRSRP